MDISFRSLSDQFNRRGFFGLSGAQTHGSRATASFRCASIFMFLLASAFCTAAETTKQENAATSVPAHSELAARLQQAIADDPRLDGAWLTLEIDEESPKDSPEYILRFRAVDRERAGKQLPLLDEIVEELVNESKFRYDGSTDFRLPYSEFNREIQELIRTDVRFPGCELLGVSYRINPNDDALELVPRFQVARDGQFDSLANECRRIVSNSPAWEGIAVFDGDPERQKVVVPEAPEPELNQLFEMVQRSVRQIPALEGAWLDVEVDDQGYPDVAPKIYVFTRGYDSQRKVAQLRAMEELAAKLIPSGRYRFDVSQDKELPLSELLEDLREEVDIDPTYAGCSISRADFQFNQDDESFDLVLQGRAWQPKQIDLITNRCRQLMARSSVWDDAGIHLNDAKVDGFKAVLGSPIQGKVFYAEAMRYFWKGDYVSADKWLSRASIEDPQNVIYRYWRVIGELAVGQQVIAERRLKKTMDGLEVRPYTQRYVEVLRAIYRVQGPLRQQLLAAELKASTLARGASDRFGY